MRKCFLHIGTPKTGTSSLQAILSARSDELQRHGFLYPRAGRDPMGAHHNISMELSRARRFRFEFGAIEDLLNEIDGTQNNVVISSEGFSRSAYEPKFRDFVTRLHHRGLKVFFVVYLRNQIDFIRSIYLELLKDGSELTLNEFLRGVLGETESSGLASPRTIFYHQLLDYLSEIKDARLLAYSYDEIEESSVIPHFLSLLGLTPQVLGVDASLRLNTETPMEEQFKRFYENRVERPLNSSEISLIDRIFDDLQTESIDISVRTKNKIIKVCAESNNAVFSKYEVPNFRRMRPAKRPPKEAKEKLCLEDIFSAEAQFFVYDLARTRNGELISGAERTDGQDVERASLARLHHDLISRHRAFAEVFDSVTAADSTFADPKIQPFPRKLNRLMAYYPLAGAYNGLIAEYDMLAQAYTDLLAVVAERDSLLAAHNGLLAEREALVGAHNGLIVERDALLGAHNGLIAERAALLGAHNRLMTERAALLGAHNRLIAERESLLGAHNGLLAERDALLGAHNGLMTERDALLGAHNRLIVERDTLLGAYNRLIAEREALLGAYNGLLAKHDVLRGAHDGLIAERDALLGVHDRLIAERDSLEQGYKKATDDLARAVHQASVERDAMQSRLDIAIGERDALLASHSWRLTAPMRALRKLLARYLPGA
jgi:hypothetical protein